METRTLIHALVREFADLLAELATHDGMLVSVADVPDRLFLELSRAIERRGIGRKVVADLFGVTLRSLQRKTARVGDDVEVETRTAWSDALAFLHERGPVSRAAFEQALRRYDTATLASVLHGLEAGGAIVRRGSGSSATLDVADAGPGSEDPGTAARALEALVWVTVYRRGPLEREALLQLVPAASERVEDAIAALHLDGRVRVVRDGERTMYESTQFAVPSGTAFGFEAAVFDQVNAVLSTITGRLAGRTPRRDATGGSTYTLDVWEGHPCHEEALSLLSDFRERMGELKSRVERHNAAHGVPSAFDEVVVFAGVDIRERGG